MGNSTRVTVGPVRVNRVGLAVCQRLLVYPGERTCRLPAVNEMHTSAVHKPGSMPCFLMTDAAAGEVRILINSFAASGCFAPL